MNANHAAALDAMEYGRELYPDNPTMAHEAAAEELTDPQYGYGLDPVTAANALTAAASIIANRSAN